MKKIQISAFEAGVRNEWQPVGQGEKDKNERQCKGKQIKY